MSRYFFIRSHVSLSNAFYSHFHQKWIVLGFCHHYANDKEPISSGGVSVGEAMYTTFDVEKEDWDIHAREIPLPVKTITAIPHGQVIEYENGDVLLTYFLVPEGMTKPGCLSIRYALTDGGFEIRNVGTLLTCEEYARGLCEPSVSVLDGKYYMTIRTDEIGLLSISEDGYTYGKPEPWKWDDGSTLENYNTMQRWIRHPDGLYLAYTRKGANNDHVFRHRAPMFMARFDEDRCCLIRKSEVILVPELGARLGNFSVTDVSANESWLITAEWMQPLGCERYGSDNSLWIAKIKWD